MSYLVTELSEHDNGSVALSARANAIWISVIYEAIV